MKVVTIVQARMGSSRLPGKVLMPLAGQSMLARVCRRAGRATYPNALLVATSTATADDCVVAECRRLGVDVFRGSEADVLDRYYQAARHAAADHVVRITADCPLADPRLIDDVCAAHLAGKADYTSNVETRTFPRGLDVEAASVNAMAIAWREATLPYQRAHVMPYFYQNPARFRLGSVQGNADFSFHRWTVDTPDDFALAEAIYRQMPNDEFGWEAVLALLADRPTLASLNSGVRQKALAEG